MNQTNQEPFKVEVQPDPTDVSKNKVFAILSYIGILFILPLICCKDSAYARFHANQGFLVFCIALIGSIISIVFGFVPVIRWIMLLVAWLIYIVALVYAILGIISAAQGNMKPLPIIGSIQIIK